MKYELMLRSRPGQESVTRRHAEVFLRLQQMTGWWACHKPLPPVKEPGTLPKSDVNLTGCFSNGVKARVSYQNRKQLMDEGRFDDYLVFEFNPQKVDFEELMASAFTALVLAFGAYRGHVGDLEFVHRDFDQDRAVESRNGVYRFHLANFFDALLSKRAFGMDSNRLASVLTGITERTQVVKDGLLVITRSSWAPIDEAEGDNMRIWSKLTESGVVRPGSDQTIEH